MREIFNQFGEVKDVSLKKTFMNPETGEQNGYGFIHYSLDSDGIDAAIRATSVICQVLIDQVLYDCCLTRSLEASLLANQSHRSISQDSTTHPFSHHFPESTHHPSTHSLRNPSLTLTQVHPPQYNPPGESPMPSSENEKLTTSSASYHLNVFMGNRYNNENVNSLNNYHVFSNAFVSRDQVNYW